MGNRTSFWPLAAALFFLQNGLAQSPLSGQRVLLFSKTAAFRHASIPEGVRAVKNLGEAHGFAVDATEDAAVFNEENLKKYRLVVFNNTTGDVLTNLQQVAFERWVQAGGGFVGIHAATDTEHKWPWYGQLVGGYFLSHPAIQRGAMRPLTKDHPATAFMADTFSRHDEIYDFYNFQKADVQVLVEVDERSYTGGKMGGGAHPISWCREFDGGRSFYTNWGHKPETFSEELFLKHLLGGMEWAASSPPLDYAKPLRSTFMPEESRFKRAIVTDKLDEPTELAVAPSGLVFFIERKGAIKVFDPKKGTVSEAGRLDVYSKFEYGLMGLGLDPHFAENRFVYLFYSPAGGQADTAQRLSRFFFDEKTGLLDMASERVVLRVPVKRNECCHTGGSIDWDREGNLFLSTGDDVNPHESKGFGPMDERPGREGWDARASSANTNDLRGKILRIRPTADGSYDIPSGNLFPKDMGRTRPEIYVMGNRNPYRISVDKANGWLYWGEVGPDSGEDSPTLGPKGFDEVNQARAPGNFGWPLFVANNRAYSERRWGDSTFVGKFFDPNRPVNRSPHSTGLEELPAAQPAFIFYPYDKSAEFGKVVGKGGRNAMAGPVFHAADFGVNANRFPPYFEGKLFIYDWMRGWVNLVSMRENGDFESMERWLPSETFANPMDMAFAPDGSLWMLEYGYNWFVANDEARLSRIEFVPGNREPRAEISVEKKAGAAPMAVQFSSEGSGDPDGDLISYRWVFDGKKKSDRPNPTFTYKKPGVYRPTLTVTDQHGKSTTKSVEILVGNEPPRVELAVAGNQTFYWNGQKILYEVKVFDKEDGATEGGGRFLLKEAAQSAIRNPQSAIEEEVQVAIDFLEGFDKNMIALGHRSNTSVSIGRRLIDGSDCRSCHAIDRKSAGPSYMDISKKYKGEWEVDGKLGEKILKGGSGVWGDVAMAAHPQLTQAEAKEMARYIMSLADEKKASKPLAGVHETDDKGKPGAYIFSASYTDRGAVLKKTRAAPQTASAVVSLRSAEVRAASLDFEEKTLTEKRDTLGELVTGQEPGAFFGFDDIDLTGIGGATVELFAGGMAGGRLEIRTGSEKGELLGSADIAPGERERQRVVFSGKKKGKERLCFVFDGTGRGPLFGVGKVVFERE